MVVCKFFQAGYCRYGKNCRFDHIYGSKYSYQANPQQAPPTQSAPVQAQSVGSTDEQLVKPVQADVQAALQGGQWILSCYSPFKEKPIFPGIHDLSPEEARLFIYEAKNTNNLDQAVAYINNLAKETRLKYEQLLQPNVNIIKVLRSLSKGETAPSPFTNEPQNVASNTNNAAASIFRSAVQTSPVFNQNVNTAQSIFSQAQNSIFSPQAPDPAKQLFAQANNANVFGPSPSQSQGNIFAPQNQNTDAKSIFAAAAQSNFIQAAPSNPSDIFSAANQNIFATQSSQNQSLISQNNNMFQPSGNPSSIFGQVMNKAQEYDPTVYSKVEELSDIDLEAFKCDSFQLGFIPELPPPQELCNTPARTQLF